MRNQAGGTTFVGSFGAELPELGLPEVAFAGRSNVGKSSAINRLLGRRRGAARVSSTPGRTQHINLFRVGSACVFADLPGYGFAKVPDEVRRDWKRVIERYLGQRETLRLVVVLVDARLPPQDLDVELVRGLLDADLPVLVLATKADKIGASKRGKALRDLRTGLGLAPEAVVPFSALTGEGVDVAWDRIEAACRAA